MAPAPCPPPPQLAEESYAEACEAWRHALDRYLRLARDGAAAAKLRAAAAAVHAAALRKGRLVHGDGDGDGDGEP